MSLKLIKYRSFKFDSDFHLSNFLKLHFSSFVLSKVYFFSFTGSCKVFCCTPTTSEYFDLKK